MKKDVQTTSTQHPHDAPVTSATYNDPGADAHYTTQPARDSAYHSGLAPEIPNRSTRRSGEFDRSPNISGEVPTSPNRHNFSYPSRNPPVGGTTGLAREEEVPVRRSGSRLADLKAVAIGLHVS